MTAPLTLPRVDKARPGTELLRRLYPVVVAGKYGVTAVVADLLSRWLVPGDRLSTVFVALICCQPSLVAGFKRGWEQLLASLLGVGVSLALLTLLPNNSLVLGAAIAITYALGAAFRWSFATLVVALFSALYMPIFQTPTLQGTALQRCEAVALGVVAAVLVNLVFVPFTRRTSLEVRVFRGMDLIRERLSMVRTSAHTGDMEGLKRDLAGWEGVFQSLHEIEGELSDLRAEAGLVRGKARRSTHAERAIQALEQALHHALDVGGAVVRLLADPPADGPFITQLAAESLDVADNVLANLQIGHHDAALTAARMELDRIRELDRAVPAPEALQERLGPRLIVLVGLAELHEHLGRLARHMSRMAAGGTHV